MTKASCRKKYLINPYAFSLVCVLMTFLLIGNILMFYFWISTVQGLTFAEAIKQREAFGFFFILALTFALMCVFVFNGYEYFGTVEIYNNRIIFRTVFRKARTFSYTEINDIGIDYGTVSGVKQFWIYCSKEKIGNQYTHNITRLPYSNTTMRIQYRKELYDVLLDSISDADIEKRLRRSYSVIRLFRVDEDK